MYGLPEIKVTIPEFNAQYVGKAGYRILLNGELYSYDEPKVNEEWVLYNDQTRFVHQFREYEMITLVDVRDVEQVRQACHTLLNDLTDEDEIRKTFKQLVAAKEWEVRRAK